MLMDALHPIATPSDFSAGDLIGFTTGLLITVLLLVLTLRAAKLPGTPRANIVFAACAFLWSAGGPANAALLAAGIPAAARLVFVSRAVQLSGVAAFPIPVLAIWRAPRFLRIAACVSTGLIVVLLWSGAATHRTVMLATAYNATLLLLLGAVTSLRRESTPRAVYAPSLVIVFGVCGAALTITFAHHSNPHLAGLGAHLVLLVLLCAFLLFARFRFADVFIRYGVRMLLAGVWATVVVFIAESWAMHLARRTPSPAAAHVFLVLFLANLLLLSFTFLDERIGTFLNRLLFHAPDYRAETRRLANLLRNLQTEFEIAAALEDAARRPLELSGARVTEAASLPASQWPAALLEGETVELDRDHSLDDLLPPREILPLPGVELLIPIASAGRVTHLLLIAPGPVRPGLVTRDLNYLAAIAAQCGQRLDALHRERESVERQSREALLVQQVTEAELSALRAQVNPHFLFNSLNTIADLIVRDPGRAEAMTLRLASVFRHVLAHSSRPLTSIRDEIDFLRTYLYIEEARFGDRLQVEIFMAPEIAGAPIPSLILQPLVENALKHGLGPKPGPGRLWISAHAEDGHVCLRVEDDGIGPSRRGESQGLGLTNVSERLHTLYHDRASLTLDPREGGGSRATVLIPLAGDL